MSTQTISDFINEITTDDEKIVLYYIIQKKVRKVSKDNVNEWLHKNEIYDVNIDNAFDLLSSFEGGTVTDDTLELGIETFRKYSSNAPIILTELRSCINEHTRLATTRFNELWNTDSFDDNSKLFIAYITDEKTRSFGARWMADVEVENIKEWESKNSLDSELSSNYRSCLELFVKNNFVYESDWTSYGNPRCYTLYPSLQKYLFNCPTEYVDKLKKVKDKHCFDLPLF